MLMRFTLDEASPPEFESFASMLVALRGAQWSISNTDLGSELTSEQASIINAAFKQMENVLMPLSEGEPNNGILLVSTESPFAMVEKLEVIPAVRDGEPVARVIVHDYPSEGETREIDLTIGGAMQAAIQLLHFVQQVGPELFRSA